MRKNLLLTTMLVIGIMIFSSCSAIAGIFKAGMWVGVIVVIVIVALVLWLIGKASK
jgi:hypothetical protein